MESGIFGTGEDRWDGVEAAERNACCFWEVEIFGEGGEGGLGVAEAVEKDEDVDR